jgi:serine/threonine-protein kinase
VNADAPRSSAASPEFSLSLAGSVVRSRYRVNAVSAVHRDVAIYSAEDVRQGRSIALKVLRDDFARDSKFADAVRSQAGALAVSGHVLRGVQRVLECGVTDPGQLFVALEWVEGATLREVLDAGGALDVPTALRIAIRVGEALEALHHNRIVHGQLGPDSVLMVTDGERIRLVGTELTAAYRTPLGLRLRDDFSLAYRAPEQVERGETTEASDVYALGVLLRQLLTAGRAGPAGSAFAAPPLAPALQRIIATALEARPVHRYPDISVMVNDIWGAAAVLAEPESRPRSVKARGNPRRRVRRSRPPFPLRITAAVVTAGIVAALVWVAGFDGFDRIVARFQSRVTPPAVTAVPIDRGVVPASETPAPESAAREQTATPSGPRAVTDTSTLPLETPVITGKPASPVDSRAGTDRSTLPPERPVLTDRSTSSPEPRAVTDRPEAHPEPRAVTDRSKSERRTPTVAKPAVTPTMVRPAPTVGSARPRPAIESRPTGESAGPSGSPAPVERRAPPERPAPAERSGTEAGDGSAVIDWLLKDRR